MIKNAIVVMFDSLQMNYLGCYGNTWMKTPNMDRLAREGVLFENSYTEGLPTVPCRRAMHTGCYTLPYSGWVPLTMEDTTIADLCWGRPIDTALVFDAPQYRLPKFGYTRSFDKVWFTHGHEADHYFYEDDALYHLNVDDYVEDSSREFYLSKYNKKIVDITLDEISSYLKQRQYGGEKEENRYVAKTMTKAIEYLQQVDRQKQFFLWIDSFDPHEPWDPPSVYDPINPCPYDPDYKGKDELLPFPDLVEGLYTEAQLNHVRMLYAELVTLCDKYLGKLMDYLKVSGLEDNTMLMMVSDHGEPMGNAEHGHGMMRKARPWPYEELVHTPLLVRCPGIQAGQRLKGFVQSCDIAPTVCDWLGIGVQPRMQGKSLLPMMRGEVEKVRDFAIAGYYNYSWSIITDDWSYIHWKKCSIDTTDAMFKDFYGRVDTDENSDGLKRSRSVDGPKTVTDRHKEGASVDGADQWTCTPASSTEVPEKDELYDRRTDPY